MTVNGYAVPTKTIVAASVIMEAYDPSAIESDGGRCAAEYDTDKAAERALTHVLYIVSGVKGYIKPDIFGTYIVHIAEA